MLHPEDMRRSVAVLVISGVVALAGCAATHETAAPTGPTGAPPALSAEIVQGRGDVQGGVVGIVVTNASETDVVVDHAEYHSNQLVEPIVAGDDSSIPAGATRALRGEITEATCVDEPVDDEVVVVLDDGTEVRLDPADPYEQIATLTEAPCVRQEVEAIAELAWAEPTIPDPAPGEVATITLRVTPTGAGSLEILSVTSTPLLTLVGADGVVATELPIGVAVAPGGPAQQIAIAVQPGRCDAHAIAEDKQGTILRFAVLLDGVEQTLVLPSTDAQRNALLGYAAAYCGVA